MLGKAFCGNGFIHLNIAEFHEDSIGGQKTCTHFGNQGSKCTNSVTREICALEFVKEGSNFLRNAFVYWQSGGR